MKIVFLIIPGLVLLGLIPAYAELEAIPIPSPEYKIVKGDYYNEDFGFGLTIPESMTGFMRDDLTSFNGEKFVVMQIHPENNFTQTSCCQPIDMSPAVMILESHPLSMLTTPVPLTGDLYAAFQGYNMNMDLEHFDNTEVLTLTLESDRDIPGFGPINRIGKFYFINTDKRYLSYGLYASPEYYQKYVGTFEESAKSLTVTNAKPINLDAIFNYTTPTELKLKDDSVIKYNVFSPSIIDSVNLDESSNTFVINITEPNSYRSFLIMNTGDVLVGPYTVTIDGKPIDSQILKNESGEYLMIFYDGEGIHSIAITGNAKIKHSLPSPLKQFKTELDFKKVSCNNNLKLIFKTSNGLPACVKSSSIEKLVERKWGSISESYPDHVKLDIIKPETIIIGKNQAQETPLTVPESFAANARIVDISIVSFEDAVSGKIMEPIDGFKENETVINIAIKEFESQNRHSLLVSTSDTTKSGTYTINLVLFNGNFNLTDSFKVQVQ